MPRHKPDANQIAVALVNAATDSEPVKGEDLIGDPDLRRRFVEAKRKAMKRAPKRRSVPAV